MPDSSDPNSPAAQKKALAAKKAKAQSIAAAAALKKAAQAKPAPKPQKSPQVKPAAPDKTQRSKQMESLLGMKFTARLVLGKCKMEIGDILNIGQGAVIELDTPVRDSLKLYVNDRLIAEAETVVVHEKFGAKIEKIEPTAQRLKDIATPES